MVVLKQLTGALTGQIAARRWSWWPHGAGRLSLR